MKGLHILQQSDCILYTDSLVNEELIAKAKKEAEIIKTSGMHLEEIVSIIVDRVDRGKKLHVFIPEIHRCMVLLQNKSHY